MKLEDIKKQNPFKVSENYFSQLEEKITSQTTEIQKYKKGNTIFSLRKFWSATGIAACLLIGFFFMMKIQNSQNLPDNSISQTKNSQTENPIKTKTIAQQQQNVKQTPASPLPASTHFTPQNEHTQSLQDKAVDASLEVYFTAENADLENIDEEDMISYL